MYTTSSRGLIFSSTRKLVAHRPISHRGLVTSYKYPCRLALQHNNLVPPTINSTPRCSINIHRTLLNSKSAAAACAVVLRRNSSSRGRRKRISSASVPSDPAGDDDEFLPSPVNFDLASKIVGQESQMVTFELEPGQIIRVRTCVKILKILSRMPEYCIDNTVRSKRQQFQYKY